jgi:hypothetical protein
MRVCCKCSSENNALANFCQICGAWLENDSAGISRGEYLTPPDREAKLSGTGKDDLTLSSGRISFQCPKCGSSKRILNRLVGNLAGNSPNIQPLGVRFFEFAISIDANPNAKLYKNRMTVRLFADICGECGHTEFKAEYPRELYQHYLQSNSEQ